MKDIMIVIAVVSVGALFIGLAAGQMAIRFDIPILPTAIFAGFGGWCWSRLIFKLLK